MNASEAGDFALIQTSAFLIEMLTKNNLIYSTKAVRSVSKLQWATKVVETVD